jgi:RHS repeat-associated protein
MQYQCKSIICIINKVLVGYTIRAGAIADPYTGNIIAIYHHTGDTLKLIEKPIYGSSRLGIVKQNITLLNGGILFKRDTFSVGLKNYELTDHLGNVTVTFLDRKYGILPDITSSSDYYPFGFPMMDRSDNFFGYRFGFNGQESDNEVYGFKASYAFEFRNYDARLGRWWGIDPLWQKYPNLSPYAYCANNPIRYIDPDGRDVWEIDGDGNIISRKKDETQDVFFMVAKDADGNYQRTFTTDADGNKTYNSISFKYKTVESQRSTPLNSTESYDTYKVRGDDNATQMFEFMSQNTTVEWSQAKTGVAGDKGLNFLTTSHDKERERGMSNLYSGQLYAGYTIRELNHNHPRNTAYPSGSFDYIDDKKIFHPIGTWGDVGFSIVITNNRQTNRLNVPIFQIYLPGSKSYISYGPNSRISDYGR